MPSRCARTVASPHLAPDRLTLLMPAARRSPRARARSRRGVSSRPTLEYVLLSRQSAARRGSTLISASRALAARPAAPTSELRTNEQARLEVVNTIKELEKATLWETERKEDEEAALERCVRIYELVRPVPFEKSRSTDSALHSRAETKYFSQTPPPCTPASQPAPRPPPTRSRLAPPATLSSCASLSLPSSLFQASYLLLTPPGRFACTQPHPGLRAPPLAPHRGAAARARRVCRPARAQGACAWALDGGGGGRARRR